MYISASTGKRGKTPEALYPDRSCVGRTRDYENKTYKRLGRPRKEGSAGKELTDLDRRNFFSVVSKYCRKDEKVSLQSLYEKLLNDYYTDADPSAGAPSEIHLLPVNEYPSFRQFHYWYKKNQGIILEIKTRDGDPALPLSSVEITETGAGKYSYPGAGYLLEASIADICLVDEKLRDQIIGRPRLYFIIDSFSKVVTGMHVSLESSWRSVITALENTIENKKEYCARYGIDINDDEWPCRQLPEVFITDSQKTKSIAECLLKDPGIRVENASPFHGDFRLIIEKYFHLIDLEMADLHTDSAFENSDERLPDDSASDAILDLRQFTRIIIRCVLFYNRSHYLIGYPKTAQMRTSGVKPVPMELWKYGVRYLSVGLSTVSREKIRYSLLPKEKAFITKKGIWLHGMFYTCNSFEKNVWMANVRIQGDESVDAAYAPDNPDSIYILMDGTVFECHLPEKNSDSAETSFAETDGCMEDDCIEWSALVYEENKAQAQLAADIDKEKTKSSFPQPDSN